MIVRIITVNVKPGAEEAFEKATVRNHHGSVQEAGVLRFDVLKDREKAGTYYLYEAYVDETATVAHKETPHYHTWKADVADLLVGERTSVSCSVVAPAEADAW
jgi:autoinducer 2-degrading protein